jgi:excisionase family DNA binding protein
MLEGMAFFLFSARRRRMTLLTDKEKFLTTGEVAEQLNVTPMTLRAWFHRGWLQAVRLPGGHLRISAAEVDRLKNGLPLGVPNE